MPNSVDETKADLIARATEVALARRKSGGPSEEAVRALLTAYYRHVPPEDVVLRSPIDLYGALAAHYRLAEQRPQGRTVVRVLTPTEGESGWSADGHTVVQVVTDDMPFLVDSVSMELGRQKHDVHQIVHPQFEVVRDITGSLQGVRVADERTAETSDAQAIRESWMHIEIDRVDDADEVRAIEDGLREVLRDVRDAVEDWDRMRERVLSVVDGFSTAPPPVPEHEIEQGSELLRWLADDHFTFLGSRDYRLEDDPDEPGALRLRAVPGTGLGILRSDPDLSGAFGRLPVPVQERARDRELLVLAKANSRATVHRNAYLDYIGVKVFDGSGEVVGEHRFLGLFSSSAYTESLTRIPLLREKATEVMRRIGLEPGSHAGKALMDTLENYPRDELFQTPVAELAEIAESVLYIRERRQLRLFVRRDVYGRFFSCLVYLPRDRYNTTVRQRLAAILKQRLGGESVEFTVRVSESHLAQVHFVVRPPRGALVEEVDLGDLERRLVEAARSWDDDFASAVRAEFGEQRGARLSRLYGDSFPEAYKEDFTPRAGSADLGRLEAIEGEDGIDLALHEVVDGALGEARLKFYRIGTPLSLSQVLPMLTSMGVEVVDERPYELVGLTRPTHLYEFGLRYGERLPGNAKELFQDAVRAIWAGLGEIDGFNALVLAAGLTWRQVSVLRAVAKYLRQGGSPFAQDYVEEALLANVELTRALSELFEARFAPGAAADDADRAARVEALEERLREGLDAVVSLDHDRILRSYRAVIRATLRTNHFQPGTDGVPKPYLVLKLDPAAIPDLPEPRPTYEIFVCSPRVEGVHLRFGAVARGGLRWSDRRDDFRTEVLGLVKAQMVKNTVIVPVGAKGGFVAKMLPDPSDREAWLAEGVACYRTFISGLLDVTDNLVDGATVPPRDVVRHDGDDAYLVVAADKGTASFSDIANSVAADYGFWLGDAFASGGSVGYDHKGMGITARGAWVSVRRHFREMGVDCQREDFTCVGIGDMSGDVFGNGMLCSEHTRLVAAFDHRDIFLDPTPDAATSYAERRRLFDLPRSSWQDYDRTLISEGGGVFSRSAKSIPLTPQMRESLGIDDGVVSMTPHELMRAVLTAPVDLLWNGGIGTYVKGSTESQAEAGDKANDPIRVNGADLRVRCVGEGGNLGMTQRGRIEYAAAGGRLNTDFIDNSAGVDTSDHEVNIKILLDGVVAAGDLTGKQRNELLAEMTDDVAALVLRDNYEQNLALANAAQHAPELLHVHEDWMKALERRGVLHRELEALPDSREVKRRIDRGQGLWTPELCVLLAWTKIVLADELIETDVPDDPYLSAGLAGYFPPAMRERFEGPIRQHPLHREIVVTQVVNDLVNGAGITYWPRLAAETGAGIADLVRASFAAREILGADAFRARVDARDNQMAAATQTMLRIGMRTQVERVARWLLNNLRLPLDTAAAVDRFAAPIQALLEALPTLLPEPGQESYREECAWWEKRGAEEFSELMPLLEMGVSLMPVVETSLRTEVAAEEVARVHLALESALGLEALRHRVEHLPRRDKWQSLARGALRDDLLGAQARLTADVLAETDPGAAAQERVAAWRKGNQQVVDRVVRTVAEICAEEDADLARMSVGLRLVRSLVSGG